MIKEITTRKEYDAIMARAEEIVAKADTIGGFEKLSKEELTEYSGIATTASRFEREVLRIFPFTGKSANPALLQLEEEMYHRRMKQKEMASFLGISTAKLSKILNGKSSINLQLAKALYEKLGFSGDLILSSI